MLILLVIIILIGIIGAVAFLNINKGTAVEDKNEADDYEISETS
jgi:hypothetical protein